MKIALASAFDLEVLSFLRCCKTAARDGGAQLVSQLKEDHFLISINATFHCCELVEQEVSIMFHFSGHNEDLLVLYSRLSASSKIITSEL